MNRISRLIGTATAAFFLAALATLPARAQAPAKPLPDAVQEVQTPRVVAEKRVEQKLSNHDQSQEFKGQVAPPSSTAFKTQPENGEVRGFEFYRDPLNAKRPMQAP